MISYPPTPRAIPPMPQAPAPPGMMWVRQRSPIECTTHEDEKPRYILGVARNVLVPITPDKDFVKCSYCSRLGAYASQCNGCGAQVQ